MWCKRKSEIQDGGSQTGILISQPVHNVVSRFRRLYLCFEGPGIQWSYFLFCVMQAEIRNPRWRLMKKEILISQPVYNLCIRVAPGETIAHYNLTVFIISAQFWQLNTYTEGTGVQWSYSLYCVMRTEIINPRWRLTLKKYWHLNLYTT